MFPLMAKTPVEEELEEEEAENEIEDEEEEDEEEAEERSRIHNITIRVVSPGGGSRSSTCGGSSHLWFCCQADECGADLRLAKRYNRRHRVCQRHAKAPVVLLSATRQRFCQQCSKFHELAMFDDTKRSCRERLASHNERRRKAQADLQHSGSDQQQSSHRANPSD